MVCFEKDVLSYQSKTDKKLHKSSRSFKGSTATITATSANRLKEAKVKLELPCLEKIQNQQRMQEDEKIQCAEAEMKRQHAEMKAEMKQRQEELRQSKEETVIELQRQKLVAKDERRIEAAKLETTIHSVKGSR